MLSSNAASAQRRVSTIVWTCNDGPFVDATLLTVFQQTEPSEIIVVDGGSRDGTQERASVAGVKVLSTQPLRGRHRQLRTAASAAHGEILLFVRAGAELPRDTVERVRKAMIDPHILAGELRFRYRPGAALSGLCRLLRLVGLYRNEHAFFAWHNAYESVGGFRRANGLEELDLIMRLRYRGTFLRLPIEAIIRPRKHDGRYRRLISQALYWLGWSPRIVGFGYGGGGGGAGAGGFGRSPEPGTMARTATLPGQNVSNPSTMPR